MSKELHPESCILISKTDQFRAIFQSLIRVALGQALVLLILNFNVSALGKFPDCVALIISSRLLKVG